MLFLWHVPQTTFAFGASDQRFVVRTESQIIDGTDVPFKGSFDFACGCIPQLGGFVMASSGYPLVVVAEGYTDYPTFMRQGKFQLSRGAIVNIGLAFGPNWQEKPGRAEKKRAAILLYRSGNRIGFLQ